MKKAYSKPEVEYIEFDYKDVVLASPSVEDGGADGGSDFEED